MGTEISGLWRPWMKKGKEGNVLFNYSQHVMVIWHETLYWTTWISRGNLLQTLNGLLSSISNMECCNTPNTDRTAHIIDCLPVVEQWHE